jgi:hypothetical protein
MTMSRDFRTWLGKAAPLQRGARVAAAVPLFVSFLFLASSAGAGDDAYRPPSDAYTGQSGVDSYRTPPPPPPDSYQPGSRNAPSDAYGPYNGPPRGSSDAGGYGEPYPYPQQNGAGPRESYSPGPPDDGGPQRGSYSEGEIVRAGNNFFGKVSGGLASAVEWAFHKIGRPNGYILGEDAGGAFVAGLAYGEGTLYTKDAGNHKVYWQGPSVGYDFGADGSKVMTLVYNLRDPSDIYARFGGIEGTAYLVGGVSVQVQKAGHVTLAPIRAGVGLRLGANVGYSKYTRNPTWNPF